MDDTDARVILLLAPAGYGKSTVARQWAQGAAAWYRVPADDPDVASVAAGLARAVLGQRAVDSVVAQRLRTVADPARDVDSLASALADDPSGFGTNGVLVIDDYHLIRSGSPAELLIAAYLDLHDGRTVVASRRRPTWATPRRVLYGEIHEIGRNALAMTREEAEEVVAIHDSRGLPGLIALADGWPAVIGLAARVGDGGSAPPDYVPETLHSFFADELFRSASPQVRSALVQLSLVPSIPRAFVMQLLGAAANHVIDEGVAIGFLVLVDDRVDLHPLLQSFLRTKLGAVSNSQIEQTIRLAADFYAAHGAWDEVLSLVDEWHLSERIVEITTNALDDLLAGGRVADIRRLVDTCRTADPAAAVIALAEAELAFREGRTEDAEAVALAAAERLGPSAGLASRLLHRAGQSAHVSDREDEALRCFSRAAEVASNDADLGRALWGHFVTAIELHLFSEAEEALTRFQMLPVSTPEDALRRVQAPLSLALRTGSHVGRTLNLTRSALPLLDATTDPVAATGFLSIYSSACSLCAAYDEALESAERQLAAARRAQLDFVIPHALCMRAAARIGLRKFAAAARDLTSAAQAADRQSDRYSQMNIAALRGRLELATGRARRAIQVLEPFERLALPARGMNSELLATLALAFACDGSADSARRCARRARRLSKAADSRALQSFALTVCLIRTSAAAASVKRQLRTSLDQVEETGAVDSFVVTYRACPEILSYLDRSNDQAVSAIVSQDPSLAKQFGLTSSQSARGSGRLTKREKEVLELLRRGLSNRQIAQTLWISEATAKVHVRHLFDKLGVRTRIEAAAHFGFELTEGN